MSLTPSHQFRCLRLFSNQCFHLPLLLQSSLIYEGKKNSHRMQHIHLIHLANHYDKHILSTVFCKFLSLIEDFLCNCNPCSLENNPWCKHSCELLRTQSKLVHLYHRKIRKCEWTSYILSFHLFIPSNHIYLRILYILKTNAQSL